MTVREKLEQINRVESGFDVKKLKYDGIQIWPIIRAYWELEFILEDKSKRKDSFSIGFIKTIITAIRSLFNYYLFDRKSKQNINKTAEVLFLADTFHKVQHPINKKWLNRIIDPIYTEVQKAFQVSYLEYSYLNKLHAPRFSKSAYINLKFLYYQIIERTTQPINGKIVGYEELKEFMEKESILLNLKEATIIARVKKVLSYKQLLKDLLIKINPKLVVFPVYYSNVNFGCTLAAKELGIKTMEVQHGQQGKYNIAYSYWENYPETPYELHPDYFWMWGQQNVERINYWFKMGKFNVFNGGNPWLYFYKNKIENQLTEEVSWLPSKEKFKHRVLISTQEISDFKKSFLIQLMKEEHDIIWCIRIHPNKVNYIPELKEFLRSNDCINYEIELSTSTPLYNLFAKVDFNVTFWSTVAYEAQIFGVNTIIAHPNGYNSMQDFINQGVFAYANTESDFLDVIKNFDFKVPKENYMDYNEAQFKVGLDTIKSIIKG